MSGSGGAVRSSRGKRETLGRVFFFGVLREPSGVKRRVRAVRLNRFVFPSAPSSNSMTIRSPLTEAFPIGRPGSSTFAHTGVKQKRSTDKAKTPLRDEERELSFMLPLVRSSAPAWRMREAKGTPFVLGPLGLARWSKEVSRGFAVAGCGLGGGRQGSFERKKLQSARLMLRCKVPFWAPTGVRGLRNMLTYLYFPATVCRSTDVRSFCLL